MTSLRSLVDGLFQPPAIPCAAGSIGAELELIPVHRSSRRRALPTADERGRGTIGVVRRAAEEHGWTEAIDVYGAPSWRIARDAGTGHVSFEPGGQIEISSPVFTEAPRLVAFLRRTVDALRAAADVDDIELLSIGVDPYNPIEDVPLVLHAPRYERMTAHFERIGPSGIRMMRQTASLQLNVELGGEPFARWRLLNALVPYLIAAFATSTEYAGAPSGYASYRAHLWQTLDASRTGLAFDSADPVGAYHRFAERAARILDDDAAHLTTLFPEVRPRGYFELRTLDAMPLDDVERAITLVHALVSDEERARRASEIVGAPDPALLAASARDGIGNATIRERVDALLALTPSRDADATATSRTPRRR